MNNPQIYMLELLTARNPGKTYVAFTPFTLAVVALMCNTYQLARYGPNAPCQEFLPPNSLTRLNRYLCHRPYCGGHSVPKRCCAAAFIVSKVDTAQIEKCYTKQTRQTSKATSLFSALTDPEDCPRRQ